MLANVVLQEKNPTCWVDLIDSWTWGSRLLNSFKAGTWRYPHCLLGWVHSKVQPCTKSYIVWEMEAGPGRSALVLLPSNGLMRDVGERKIQLLDACKTRCGSYYMWCGWAQCSGKISQAIVKVLKGRWDEGSTDENREGCRAWEHTSRGDSAWAYQSIWGTFAFLHQGETPGSL